MKLEINELLIFIQDFGNEETYCKITGITKDGVNIRFLEGEYVNKEFFTTPKQLKQYCERLYVIFEPNKFVWNYPVSYWLDGLERKGV